MKTRVIVKENRHFNRILINLKELKQFGLKTEDRIIINDKVLAVVWPTNQQSAITPSIAEALNLSESGEFEIDFIVELRFEEPETLKIKTKRDLLVVEKELIDMEYVMNNFAGIQIMSNGVQKVTKYTRILLDLELTGIAKEINDYLNLDLSKYNLSKSGVLVHGIEGVGKTFVVNQLNLPKIDHKYLHEAKNYKKCLIENIELIPSSELIPILDSCVVVGTTSNLQKIDMRLRRPGRFDLEIEVPVPSRESREDILVSMCGISLPKVAEQAHGFVASDLRKLVIESKILAYRRNEPLSEAHFMESLQLVKPSSLSAPKIPKVKWSDIGGQQQTKQQLIDLIHLPLNYPHLFVKFKIKPPKGILLYGPPGCSKTLLAKAISTESSSNFIAVKGPELFDKYVGESEKAIRNLFQRARTVSPCIIFFDEIDSIGSSRKGVGVGDRVLSQLLTEMDGISDGDGVVVVAATNRPDMLDSALLRPGRFDSSIYVPPPDNEARKHIFELQKSKMKWSSDINIDDLVFASQGYSGAEVVGVCQQAAFIALERDINAEEILKSDIATAMHGLTKRITKEMLDFYEEYSKR